MSEIGIRTTFGGINFRSRTEARTACFLDGLGMAWEYEPIDLEGYIPDFIISAARPMILEVKADMTIEDLFAHAPKIDATSWKDEAAIIGGALHGSTFGIIREDSRWLDAFFFECHKCERFSITAASHPRRCRMCGKSVDRLGANDEAKIRDKWNDSKNLTQWMPKRKAVVDIRDKNTIDKPRFNAERAIVRFLLDSSPPWPWLDELAPSDFHCQESSIFMSKIYAMRSVGNTDSKMASMAASWITSVHVWALRDECEDDELVWAIAHLTRSRELSECKILREGGLPSDDVLRELVARRRTMIKKDAETNERIREIKESQRKKKDASCREDFHKKLDEIIARRKEIDAKKEADRAD